MSHLTKVRNVYARKDLLLEALRTFPEVRRIEENSAVRYWSRAASNAAIVAVLGSYDLGFNWVEAHGSAIRDSSETASDVEVASLFLEPICDFYNGEIERVFGKGLCKLNQEYYTRLLAEQATGWADVEAVENEKEIVITMEINV